MRGDVAGPVGLALALALWTGPAGAADGKAIYAEVCAVCHQPAGEGAPGLAPPLKSAVVAQAAKSVRDYVPLVVLNGLSGTIRSEGQTYTLVMPPQSHLSDADIAAVATYVYRTLGGAKGVTVTAKTVAALRATPRTAADLVALRGSP